MSRSPARASVFRAASALSAGGGRLVPCLLSARAMPRPSRLVSGSVLVAALALFAACADDAPNVDAGVGDAGSGDAGLGDGGGAADGGTTDGGAPEDLRYLGRLEGASDLARLTARNAPDVKYLAPIVGRDAPLAPGCYFQNMQRFAWHLQFLQSFPELRNLAYDAYVAMVMRARSRVFHGGSVALRPQVAHPLTQAIGVLTFTLYAEPGQTTVDDVVETFETLAGCAPFARGLLAYLPEDPTQKAFAQLRRAELAARGVAVVFPEDLLRGVPFETYAPGVGYGTLRVVPEGQTLSDYGLRDVVVVESAPNDISLVAGLITKDRQSLHSHVNLRLGEKRVPSAAVPSIYTNQAVRALDGRLVRVVATATVVEIQPARLADAEAFWAATRPSVPAPVADLSVTALGGFEQLRAADARAYGAKAANLGELNRALPTAQRPDGFGVPFAWFDTFARDTGVAADIAALQARTDVDVDGRLKATVLRALRRRIRDQAVPPARLDALIAELRARFGAAADTTFFRLRSSTNVEDLATISGAGLYESRSGCIADELDGDALGPSRCLSAREAEAMQAELTRREAELAADPTRVDLAEYVAELREDLTEEKPLSRALLRVWSSLFTDRAYDEREYFGIDHTRVFMAVAVHPSYRLERANLVVVTGLGDPAAPVARVVTQVGELSVVQPELVDATPETALLTITSTGGVGGFTVQVPAALHPEGPVLPPDARARLARLLFDVQRHFEAEVYPSLRPLRLDLELKWSADGEVECKQARPYLGRGELDAR